MIVPTRVDDQRYTALEPTSDSESAPQSPETNSQYGKDTTRTEEAPLDDEDTAQPTPMEETPLEPSKEECSQSATDIFSEDPELGLPDTDAKPKQHQPLPVVFHIIANTALFLSALVLLHLSALFPHYLVYQLLGPTSNNDSSLRLRFAIYLISSWGSCIGFAALTFWWWETRVRCEEGEDEPFDRRPESDGSNWTPPRTFQATMGRSLLAVEMMWAAVAVAVLALSLFVFFSKAGWKVLGGMVEPAA